MKISKENIITRKDFLKILQDTLQNQIVSNNFGKCIVQFLQKHPETWAFDKFLGFFEYSQKDTIDQGIENYQDYLRWGWNKIFEDMEDEDIVDFVEYWMGKGGSELFFKFLKKECNIQIQPSWEEKRMKRVLARYLRSVDEDKKYSQYWKEGSVNERFFDGYISFIYNYPNSQTAKKFQELFEREGADAIDMVFDDQCYLQILENWVHQEDINLLNEILEEEFNLSLNPKKRLLQIIDDHIKNIGRSDFSRIADCLMMFLYENPDSKTFESFLEYAEQDNWLCNDKPWDPFCGVKDCIEFIHGWIDENEIDMFKKFLKEECEIEIENDPETK
jgi:hypothetical protein